MMLVMANLTEFSVFGCLKDPLGRVYFELALNVPPRVELV